MIVDKKLVCDICDNNHNHVYQDINWYNSKATYTNDICEQCLIDRSPHHNQRSREDIIQERERILAIVRERQAKRKRSAEV